MIRRTKAFAFCLMPVSMDGFQEGEKNFSVERHSSNPHSNRTFHGNFSFSHEEREK
jgi:hypothetical protein